MSQRTAAYVMDRPDLIFRDEDAPMLDQLNFSFALVKDGALSGDHWRSIDAYRAFVAKHPHILPVVSAGGWGADGFSQAAATEEGRRLFVESAMDLMQTYGFLGLDIDWEYPCSSAGGIASSEADRENFSLLMKALRNGLDQLTQADGRPRLLACALGAPDSLVGNIDCAYIGTVADQINLMTYDMYHPGICCHHTALYATRPELPVCADSAVQLYTQAGIPAEKIMIGCAMYGRTFLRSSKESEPLYAQTPSNGSDTLHFYEFYNDPDYQFYFDPDAIAAYAVSDSLFVSCDTPRSIAHKYEYAQNHRLMGLMCWEYGGDAEGLLLRAMRGNRDL